MQYLVEYHFGRLSPQLNAAVEAHIQDCKICQRQGLSHAATEKREVARQLRKVRANKPRLSGRGRGLILFLAVVAVLQIGVYELSRGSGSPLGSLFGSHPSSAATAPTTTATPPPVPLTSSLTYDPSSAATVALALSPDGKTLASASLKSAAPTVTLWSSATGKATATLMWPGQAVPGALAWSPDGKSLAAADGALIGVWSLPTTTPTWTLTLPAAPALRVYNVGAATITQEPDPVKTFANGSLLHWDAGDALSTVTPTPGAASPVTVSGGQDIGLWRGDGSHLVPDGKGGVLVGIARADGARHAALLSWSPDGHYLLWGAVNQSVALPTTTSQPQATPAPSATAGTASPGGIPVPNAPAGAIAHNVAASGRGDALIWFAPDGHLMAVCDRSAASGALDVYDVASGRIVSQLAGACAGMALDTLAWDPAASALVIAGAGKPIAVYPLKPSGS